MDYRVLVENLRDGNLAAFVGAGASRTYTDSQTKRTYPGVYTASEIVQSLADRRNYIDTSLTFPEACFLLKHKEGRSSLEKLLCESLDRPATTPLPAHVILANLPFSAFLTTNCDQLLERALSEARRRPHSIVNDEDISLLRPKHVPVVKIHGCVSRPTTIIAAEDEYQPFAETKPVVEAFMKAYLAHRVLIFLGYSLTDIDFTLVYNALKSNLGDHMPRSYAVVYQDTDYRKIYWKQKGVEIIESDLTEFLRSLLRATAESNRPVVYHPGEDWINNSFFESLHRIRTLPSETQVIDAFLQHLLQEMRSPNFSLEDVLARAQTAASLVLRHRNNFGALRRLSDSLLERIRTECADKDAAETLIQADLTERLAIGRGISSKGSQYVERGDCLLIYSQSIRVAELLRGVPAGVQDTCQIYIAECRPKSPQPFQDALAFCEALASTGYEMTIIPDAAVANLIARRQVHKVFMGAHTIYTRNRDPQLFVNTCGSQSIILASREYGVPVYVVAETAKLIGEPKDGAASEVSFDQEEDIFGTVSSVISELRAAGHRVSTFNIGYDLCPIADNVSVITEES